MFARSRLHESGAACGLLQSIRAGWVAPVRRPMSGVECCLVRARGRDFHRGAAAARARLAVGMLWPDQREQGRRWVAHLFLSPTSVSGSLSP